MPKAARRQRLITSKASAHHSANQNTGWVMADISWDNTNIKTFYKKQPQKKSPTALSVCRISRAVGLAQDQGRGEGREKKSGSDPNLCPPI
jgi:hypothetical protein